MTDTPTQRPAAPSRFIYVACGVASIAAAVVMIFVVRRMAVDFPFADEWEWTRIIVAFHHGRVPLGDLWRQHDEQRLFFPGLIALALDRAGGWSQVRECLTSVALVVLSQLIVLKLLRATFGREVALPLLLVDSLLLFSPSQSQNWIWGFQIAWFLINAATLATVWLLSAPRLGPGRVTAAAACAIVASYSSVFGLNAFLAGLIVLVMRADGKRIGQIGWAVLGAATGAVFLIGFHRTTTGPAQHDLLRVGSLVHYALSYLGLPFGRSLGLGASTLLGIAVVAAFIAAVAAIVRTPRAQTGACDRSAPWLGLAAFALVTAAMTAVGRAHNSALQSLAGRYETESDIFWIATIALCADALERLRAAQRIRNFSVFALLAALIGAWLYARNATIGLAEMRGYGRLLRNERMAFMLGSAAPAADRALLYPAGELMLHFVSELKGVHDGPAIGPNPPRGSVSGARAPQCATQNTSANAGVPASLQLPTRKLVHTGTPLRAFVSAQLSAPGGATLFVSDALYNAVEIYSASGRLTATLTGVVQPAGIAVDKFGSLYVADEGNERVLVYAKGYTAAPKVLNDPGAHPQGVAVDGGGNVGVTNFAYGASSVSFYPKGATNPTKTVWCSGFAGIEFDAFDRRGNLYIDGEDDQADTLVGVILGGRNGDAITPLTTQNRIAFPGGIAVTPDDRIAIGDRNGRTIDTYAAARHGTLGAPLSVTPLSGSRDPVTFAFTPDAALISVDAFLATAKQYTFPAAGKPRTTVHLIAGGLPVGVALAAPPPH